VSDLSVLHLRRLKNLRPLLAGYGTFRYDGAMEPLRISCPLCRSDRVRLVASTDKLLVCACDACPAQFTVLKPTPDALTES
jgi:hypothetical protein